MQQDAPEAEGRSVWLGDEGGRRGLNEYETQGGVKKKGLGSSREKGFRLEEQTNQTTVASPHRVVCFLLHLTGDRRDVYSNSMIEAA